MPTVAGYQPRSPERDALRQIVREHFETFRARARVGGRLPRFVEQAFRAHVTCGSLAGGFARFRCAGCGFERLVPFSCTGRGFCPYGRAPLRPLTRVARSLRDLARLIPTPSEQFASDLVGRCSCEPSSTCVQTFSASDGILEGNQPGRSRLRTVLT